MAWSMLKRRIKDKLHGPTSCMLTRTEAPFSVWLNYERKRKVIGLLWVPKIRVKILVYFVALHWIALHCIVVVHCIALYCIALWHNYTIQNKHIFNYFNKNDYSKWPFTSILQRLCYQDNDVSHACSLNNLANIFFN
jgi:hypothetical protein